MAAPRIFDRPLIRRRLLRARAAGYADFLLRRAVDDLEDRLAAVLRPFPLALDIGTPTPAATEWLRSSGRIGTTIRLAHGAERDPDGLTAVADEEALPVAGERFDLAVSLLALHAVNDLPGALVQVRRALKPDGLFIACLLGGDTLIELRQAFAQGESESVGGASPRVAPFADLRDLGNLLGRAGFALPVADVDTLTVRYPDPIALMRDLRGMGLTNPLHDRRRAPLRRETLVRAAAAYAERFADADGRVRATFDLVWLSGWAPHASQQKPLAPGSARTRLADALGIPELGTGKATP